MSDTQIKAMMQGIENLWSCFDQLLDDLKTPEDWAQPHGTDWTLADVPYHMMYTDRELVADAIRRGQDVPPEEQKVQRTLRQLNEWNENHFAERPADQTPQQSLEQWRAGRGAVRDAISSLQDEDLMTKMVWFPLVGCGWVPAMVSVGFALAHTWSEFMQLRYHMGRSAPEPAPMTTHGALGFLINFLPAFMDMEAAAKTKLTTVMAFSGDGGGSWTLSVNNAPGQVSEGADPNPDLVITQTPETFELIRQNKLDPMTAMQTGAMLVEGMEHLETYGLLFPAPSLDREIPPMGPGAAS